MSLSALLVEGVHFESVAGNVDGDFVRREARNIVLKLDDLREKVFISKQLLNLFFFFVFYDSSQVSNHTLICLSDVLIKVEQNSLKKVKL